ncbi:hypothetical protein RJ639_025358 [Escallonia herrerae]|uniref:CBF1-interacting co-repressor CIR N-terminal domain-containing protein n=1 Tax=Escallonia herrerae TaxID=1293975 RepID=A0AA88S353_9ASTE|nr:hypothetical protein RJ639_025358 [Escallonia herrerae]
MALKFLNKKGWHTGNLRNIENVWKAEKKHDAEQKKITRTHALRKAPQAPQYFSRAAGEWG